MDAKFEIIEGFPEGCGAPVPYPILRRMAGRFVEMALEAHILAVGTEGRSTNAFDTRLRVQQVTLDGSMQWKANNCVVATCSHPSFIHMKCCRQNPLPSLRADNLWLGICSVNQLPYIIRYISTCHRCRRVSLYLPFISHD